MSTKDATLIEKKIRALCIARAHIQSNRRDFVCHALDAVAVDFPSLHCACYELQRYIVRVLSPHTTLGAWANANIRRFQDMRANRIQWLDWMVCSLRRDIAEIEGVK